MNFYKIVGQVTAKTSFFLKNIGFANIKSFEINSDTIDIFTRCGLNAQIRYNNPGVKGVYWSIEDFELRAEERADYHNGEWQDVYDITKFQEALDKMIDKYDCNNGITWVTVDYYLDEICLKKNKNE